MTLARLYRRPLDYSRNAGVAEEARRVSTTADPADGPRDVTTARPGDQRSIAARLGLRAGQTVQEIGYDEDCDNELRDSVVGATGIELVDEDYDEVVDVVLLWWREGDGDLVDALVDALTSLAGGGDIWLLTPKAGREGHVEPSDISEAAPTAGLSQTTSLSAARDWSGARLVAPKASRTRR
jgi:hypothetical protein